ncbi:hypothetical protein PLANPX_3248 [Lacipirellula parvula]|uniref:Uncharacterized protein n=1 Tax=Lacipirellula parvula TaxID=2650471 RepID=A0A5K7XH71_9BACT|nr:hypothetical protein PLANPX_3248 [Lacipirellula parvula]
MSCETGGEQTQAAMLADPGAWTAPAVEFDGAAAVGDQ